MGLVLGLVLALLGVSCGNNTSAAPTTPTPASPTITQVFNGTLPVGGSSFYSFSMSVYGTVNATLLDIEGNGVPPTVTVALGIGTLSSTSCSPTSPTNVQIGGTVLATTTEQPGTYCVNIADIGNLFSPATFSIEIDHP